MSDDAPTPGIDHEAVSAFLSRSVAGATAPFEFALVGAGGSNLSYIVTDANGARVVLRRPPTRGRIATAHDMAREFRIMSALGPSPIPVPAMLAFCDDAEVTGADFYVMGFAEGTILRTSNDATRLGDDIAHRAAQSLVDTQVAFHKIDLDAVGLAGLGRHEGYVERQLNRWYTQFTGSKTRELPALDDLHSRLSKAVPTPSGPPGLAHGDYRFDNTVLGPDGAIVAVLDWELCTIGDPVADFAWSLQYWADPGDDHTFLADSPTLHPAFPRRSAIVDRYADASGLDLDALGYFAVFSWWKMACILEGVYARRLRGAQSGAATGAVDQIAAGVTEKLAVASRLADGVI